LDLANFVTVRHKLLANVDNTTKIKVH